MAIKTWKTLKSRIIARDKFLGVIEESVELPSGRKIRNYKLIKSPDIVAIFALTKNNKVVMINEYKHGAKKVLLTIPSGLVEKGESLRRSAMRELQEETGYGAEKLVKLASLREFPKRMRHRLHIFLADRAFRLGEQKLDKTENIDVSLMSFEDLKEMVIKGKIESSVTVAATFFTMQKLK